MAELTMDVFNDTFFERLADAVDNGNSELFVAVVALVISIIALVAAVLQLAQQYFASATGYSECNTNVMGRWAETRKRRLRWSELRFEVQFDAPVIFLCPPDNKKGPLPGEPIIVTGEDASLANTCTELQEKAKTDKERIQTADNEKATWIILLTALQRLERESNIWQQKQFKNPLNLPPPSEHPLAPPALMEGHTLAAAVQSKRRSWDTMPDSVKKPYATTTICHLVEMMAVLGIHWVEFDRSHDRYRGEGNGYMVTCENVSKLGLMFSFFIYGKNRFEENRVIPVDEVKELCFGVVPTIYRETLDPRKLQSQAEDTASLSVLRLGSETEVAETLTVIGCNTNTIKYFATEGAKHTHLFPVIFEVIGMLGRTLHIERSCYRMLPNPTVYRWDRKGFSLRKMMRAFEHQFKPIWLSKKQHDEAARTAGRFPTSSALYNRIGAHAAAIIKKLDNLPPKGSSAGIVFIPLLNALHSALDDMDEVLTAKRARNRPDGPGQLARENTGLSGPVFNRVDSNILVGSSTETSKQRTRREIVQDVLRSHVQAVLLLLNKHMHEDSTAGFGEAELRLIAARTSFDDIDAAAPEDRQDVFMRIYFDVVCEYAVRRATRSAERRGSVAMPPRSRPSHAEAPAEQAVAEADEESPGVDAPTVTVESSADLSDATATNDATWTPDVLLTDIRVTHEDVWYALMFRMICWLMLHDFHKNDVQKPKSELLGSRLPVYVS